jgi:hypothetical protein
MLNVTLESTRFNLNERQASRPPASLIKYDNRWYHIKHSRSESPQKPVWLFWEYQNIRHSLASELVNVACLIKYDNRWYHI